MFITHDLNEALKIGDRIAIMRDGEIIQRGSPEEIVTLPADDYVSEFVQDVSKAKVIQAKAIMQDTDAVVHEWQGPRAALHIMKSRDTQCLFLLGRGGDLKGLVTEDRAAGLTRDRVERLGDVEIEPAMVASPDDFIEDIIPLAAQTHHPIAVVNEAGILVGEVHRGELLAGMVEGGLGEADKEG